MGRPGHQQGVRCKAPKKRRLRRTNVTPQGEATEGNAADDTLMVDQGWLLTLTFKHHDITMPIIYLEVTL